MRNIDFLAIGDVTTDAFIRIKEASVHCSVDKTKCELCVKFADKIPYEFVEVLRAVGNSPNAAVSASRLGLSSYLVADIGGDLNGKECLTELKRNKVNVKYVSKHRKMETNYHYVLWYEDERTILVKHQEYPYAFPNVVKPKWIYLSSLASNSLPYHLEIATYLNKNPDVKLCFQPGTFQMKLGFEKLKDIYAHTELFVCNVEEAQRILESEEKDVKKLMSMLRAKGPKTVLVTDGPKGAYFSKGDKSYYMPPYPDPKPPYERTGCGDAFTSTFVSALLLGKSELEALRWAPINPMSVVQYTGAQKGLLTRTQLEDLLSKAPVDFVPKEI